MREFIKKRRCDFFMFEGHCTDCKTYVHGECNRDFAVNDCNIQIKISTYNTKDISHSNKRKLARTRRIDAQKKLINQPASEYRKETALKVMKFNDPEPYDLNKTAVYRKARQTAKDCAIGVDKGSTDVFESLEYFKDLGYGIRQISDFEVGVSYFTNDQLELWDRIVSIFPRLVGIIDSTGGVALPVDIEGNKSGYICLHQFITSIPDYNKPIPITQLLSERQDMNKLEYWLNCTFTDDRIPPKEIVIDGSLALANAVSLAFNKCTYNKYLQLCLSFLKNEIQMNQLPYCFIRHDIAHAIHAVTRWPAFKKQPLLKDFYTRCFGYCIEQEFIEEISSVILAIFVISGSPTMERGSICEKMKDDMLNKFKIFQTYSKRDPCQLPKSETSHLEDLKNHYADCENEMDLDMEDFLNTNDTINEYLQDIYTESENIRKKDGNFDEENVPATARANNLYCPRLKNNIFYTYSQLFSWSNVMCAGF